MLKKWYIFVNCKLIYVFLVMCYIFIYFDFVDLDDYVVVILDLKSLDENVFNVYDNCMI